MARSRPVADAKAAGFTGFGPGALQFFAELADNQNREWFEAHRPIFEQQIRAPMAALVEALAFTFAAQDIALTGSPKTSLFRINRDVRFSNDKRPYKTNASAVLSRDGNKHGVGVLYIQIGGVEPAFAALGFYGPEPDDLHALRQAIAASPQSWASVEKSLQGAGLALSREPALIRLPKGFEAQAGAPFADALRLKSFVVRKTLRPESLFSAALADEIAVFARNGMALLAFGRNAIDQGRAWGRRPA